MKPLNDKLSIETYVDFADWESVCTSFSTSEPKPDHVIYARYEDGGYDGSALVVYRNKDKYYLVYGSHCSCYGLEDQFNPTEYNSKDELINAVDKCWFSWKDDVLELLRKIK